MTLLDASGLVAALFSKQREHAACRSALERAEPPLVLSPFVLGEIDYLISKFGGRGAARDAFLEQVESGAYELAPFDASALGEARAVLEAWPDQRLDLADASIVVLSRRHATTALLTLDQRHFRVLRGYRNRPFRILPADG